MGLLEGRPGDRGARSLGARVLGVDAPGMAHWRADALAAGVSLIVALGMQPETDAGDEFVILGIENQRFLTEIGVVPVQAFAHLVAAHLARARAAERLRHADRRDPLTALYNRRGFLPIARRAHARAGRRTDVYSVLLVDIEQMERVNDEYGYERGDALLKAIGARIVQLLPRDSTVARWSGAGFACLLPGTAEPEAAMMAARLAQTLHQEPIVALLGGMPRISAGAAGFPGHSTVERAITAAGGHLGRGRLPRQGRGAHRRPKTDADLSLIAQIRTALAEGRIRAAYQPIVELATGRVVAEEALARLISPDGGTEYPAGRFIETVTRFGLVQEIDAVIMREALARCAAQVLAGASRLHFVNMSAAFLRHTGLIEEIFVLIQQQCRVCGQDPTAPKPMVIEVTEREFVRDTAAALAVLKPLIDFGLRIAIDDFGSGYSSFRYLVDLPVSFVKLEGELVRKIANDRKARTVVQSIQTLADDLGLVTVAEYVEDELSWRILREMGVHWGQGYFLGHPRVDAPGTLP